jgi:hypothetical protein
MTRANRQPANAQARPTAPTWATTPVTDAMGTDSSPAATGRSRLVGWCRSESASRLSLTK